jgi:predicted nucleic acid-binding protein
VDKLIEIRFGLSLEDARADLVDLNHLGLNSTPTEDLIEDALVLAHAKNLTTNDACYAVLAHRLEIPLITADEQMVKAIDWSVWLGDYQALRKTPKPFE